MKNDAMFMVESANSKDLDTDIYKHLKHVYKNVLLDRVFSDPMFKQMIQTLVLDLILFTLIYFINFCILKPTRIYDKNVMSLKFDSVIGESVTTLD